MHFLCLNGYVEVDLLRKKLYLHAGYSNTSRKDVLLPSAISVITIIRLQIKQRSQNEQSKTVNYLTSNMPLSTENKKKDSPIDMRTRT